MIRDGATMIRGAPDLLEDLGADEVEAPPPPDLEHDELRVWNALTEAKLPEAVATTAGMSIPASVAILMHLELRGLVVNAGGRYQRRYQSSTPTLASPPSG
jgi:predicted Rossmann fold nucleotide-binding protein DprA/Smf involved in DNA uptake